VAARGGQGRAEQEGGGQRAQARGEADQAEGANQDRAARIAQLAPGLGCSHGSSQLFDGGAGGQAGEAGRGGGGDASPDEDRAGDQAWQAGEGEQEGAGFAAFAASAACRYAAS
jgi:hypothetical protein